MTGYKIIAISDRGKKALNEHIGGMQKMRLQERLVKNRIFRVETTLEPLSLSLIFRSDVIARRVNMAALLEDAEQQMVGAVKDKDYRLVVI